MELFSLFFYTH